MQLQDRTFRENKTFSVSAQVWAAPSNEHGAHSVHLLLMKLKKQLLKTCNREFSAISQQPTPTVTRACSISRSSSGQTQCGDIEKSPPKSSAFSVKFEVYRQGHLICWRSRKRCSIVCPSPPTSHFSLLLFMNGKQLPSPSGDHLFGAECVLTSRSRGNGSGAAQTPERSRG